MTYEEACAWLRGERSMTNIIPQDPIESWQVRIAQADAAMCEQAYWIAKAHKDAVFV
jgi:hypothetical protein